MLFAGLFARGVSKIVPFRYWIMGGLIAFFVVIIGFQCVNNGRLKSLNGELTQRIEDVRVENALARDVIATQTASMASLDALLADCQQLKVKVEVESARAISDLENKLSETARYVRNEMKAVRRALQNETCAVVVVPDDVGRVLRNGAARTNGD